MKVIECIEDLKAAIKLQKKHNKSIGFVPTMGYLHEGHLSLVKQSVSENDITVMSIFVNPTQFGVNEDFDKYPRDLSRDKELAQSAGVDILFTPTATEMYPQGYKTYVDVEDITKVLCGKSRPGHFKGVTTVVAKLFNLIEPQKAYFGQKDAQQVVVIQKMVKDLNMNLEIVVCPIIREADGLAMSSRNVYLSKEERVAALVLSKALSEAEKRIQNGEKSKSTIMNFIVGHIGSEPLAQIDYIEIVDAEDLKEIETIEGKTLIALAVKFLNTRLIDNILVGE